MVLDQSRFIKIPDRGRLVISAGYIWECVNELHDNNYPVRSSRKLSSGKMYVIRDRAKARITG